MEEAERHAWDTELCLSSCRLLSRSSSYLRNVHRPTTPTSTMICDSTPTGDYDESSSVCVSACVDSSETCRYHVYPGATGEIWPGPS